MPGREPDLYELLKQFSEVDLVDISTSPCKFVCIYDNVDSPEAEVQDFHDVRQQPRSVVLEWLPPRRPDVTRYKVGAD